MAQHESSSDVSSCLLHTRDYGFHAIDMHNDFPKHPLKLKDLAYKPRSHEASPVFRFERVEVVNAEVMFYI